MTLAAATTPSKSFFVDMLTRDIELYDAILDLIDNSLDGAARLSASRDSTRGSAEKRYSGFSVEIDFGAGHFKVKDNCGGIPLDIAKKFAFAMGRPSDKPEDDSLPTIGVYGIGMKRAIFKIGRSASVVSKSYKTSKLMERFDYRVDITSDWMDEEGWSELPIKKIDTSDDELGTTIHVTNLIGSVRKRLSKRDSARNLREKVAIHYALILEQGFEISIKGPHDDDESARVEAPDEFFSLISLDEEVVPYIAAFETAGVNAKIFAGFVEDPARSAESRRAAMETNKSKRSGWTIACNDRIVLWRDRGVLTNWGVNKVPTYHAQFNQIAGLVLLYGDSKDLPLTTTKAGVDLSHEVYIEVLGYIAKATKTLTTYTNTIKKDPDAYSEELSKATPVSVTTLLQKSQELVDAAVDHGPVEQPIKLPKIVVSKGPKRTRISFGVDPADLETVRVYLDMKNSKPSEVGQECFDLVLSDADE